MAIKIRRGNKADLVVANLVAGEPVFAFDTKEFGIKANDGSMVWISTLDANGKVPYVNLGGVAAGTNGDANNALKLGSVAASTIIDGTGNAQNALKLGGLAASLYPHTDVIDQQNTLTLLNGWTASWGSLDVRRFGRVVMISFNGGFSGTANTIIANLPDGWNPSGSWVQLGGNLVVIEGNAIRVVNASISTQTFTIVV